MVILADKFRSEAYIKARENFCAHYIIYCVDIISEP